MLDIIYVVKDNSETKYEVKDNTIISGEGIAALYGTMTCEAYSCGIFTQNGTQSGAYILGADMYFHSKVDDLVYYAGKITRRYHFR